MKKVLSKILCSIMMLTILFSSIPVYLPKAATPTVTGETEQNYFTCYEDKQESDGYYWGKNIVKKYGEENTWTVTIGLNNFSNLTKNYKTESYNAGVDVVCLIDGSGSMAFTTLQMRKSIQNAYNALPKNSRIKFIVQREFLGAGQHSCYESSWIDHEVNRTTPIYQDSLNKVIKTITTYCVFSPLYTCNAYSGMQKVETALNLSDVNNDGRRKIVLFFTDGTPDGIDDACNVLNRIQSKKYGCEYNAVVGCAMFKSLHNSRGYALRFAGNNEDHLFDWTSGSDTDTLANALKKLSTLPVEKFISSNHNINYFNQYTRITDYLNTDYFEFTGDLTATKIKYVGDSESSQSEYTQLSNSVNGKGFNWRYPTKLNSWSIGTTTGKYNTYLVDEEKVPNGVIYNDGVLDLTLGGIGYDYYSDTCEVVTKIVDGETKSTSSTKGYRLVLRYDVKLKDGVELPSDTEVPMFYGTNDSDTKISQISLHNLKETGRTNDVLVFDTIKVKGTEPDPGSSYALEIRYVLDPTNSGTVNYATASDSSSFNVATYDAVHDYLSYTRNLKAAEWKSTVKTNVTLCGYSNDYYDWFYRALDFYNLSPDASPSFYLTEIKDGMGYRYIDETKNYFDSVSPYSTDPTDEALIKIWNTPSSNSDGNLVNGLPLAICPKLLGWATSIKDAKDKKIAYEPGSSFSFIPAEVCSDFEITSNNVVRISDEHSIVYLYAVWSDPVITIPSCYATADGYNTSNSAVWKNNNDTTKEYNAHDSYTLESSTSFTTSFAKIKDPNFNKEYSFTFSANASAYGGTKDSISAFPDSIIDLSNPYTHDSYTLKYDIDENTSLFDAMGNTICKYNTITPKFVGWSFESDTSPNETDSAKLITHLEDWSLKDFCEAHPNYEIPNLDSYKLTLYAIWDYSVAIAGAEDNNNKKTFVNWTVGTETYSPYSSIQLHNDITLTPNWSHTVTYIDQVANKMWAGYKSIEGEDNIATVSSSAYYLSDNDSITIDNGETIENSTFLGWNTAKDGSGTVYKPGDTYSSSDNLVLYAMRNSTSISENAENKEYDDYLPGDTVTYDIYASSTLQPSEIGNSIISLKDNENLEITEAHIVVDDNVTFCSSLDDCKSYFSNESDNIVVNLGSGNLFMVNGVIPTALCENNYIFTDSKDLVNSLTFIDSLSTKAVTFDGWTITECTTDDGYPYTLYEAIITTSDTYKADDSDTTIIDFNGVFADSDCGVGSEKVLLSYLGVSSFADFFYSWNCLTDDNSEYPTGYTVQIDEENKTKTYVTQWSNSQDLQLLDDSDYNDYEVIIPLLIDDFYFYDDTSVYINDNNCSYVDCNEHNWMSLANEEDVKYIVPIDTSGYREFVKWEISEKTSKGKTYKIYTPIWKEILSSDEYISVKTFYIDPNGGKINDETEIFSIDRLNRETLKWDHENNASFTGFKIQYNKESNELTYIAQWDNSTTPTENIEYSSGGFTSTSFFSDYLDNISTVALPANQTIHYSVTAVIKDAEPSSTITATSVLNAATGAYTETNERQDYTATVTIGVADYRKVVYNLSEVNGKTPTGEAPVDKTAYRLGENNTATILDGSSLKLAGYKFIGWTTTEGGSKVEYAAGDTLAIDNYSDSDSENINLYPVFEESDETSLPKTGTYGIIAISALSILSIGIYLILKKKEKPLS